MTSETIVIVNPSGLHARPASNFVKLAARFHSSVEIVKNGKSYNAKSIVSILSACVKYSETIEIRVNGEDEQEALTAVVDAVKSGLGEKIEA